MADSWKFVFKLIPAIEKFEYNAFIAAQKTGSFLQSWEWGQWQETLGRKVFRFFIIDGGQTVGAMQLIKMPLPMGKCYLYCPYGPVVGKSEKSEDRSFDSEGRALRLRLEENVGSEVIESLEKEFSDAIFIRLEPKDLALSPEPLALKVKNIQPGKTLVIDLSKSEEQMLAEMHHKTRYNIRLAQKHGVEIKSQFDLNIGNGFFAKEAVELIVATSERQEYKGFNEDYYHKMINQFILKPGGDLKLQIYKAIYNNQLLASAIIIDFGDTRTYLFGGSSEENKNVMAPYLLHWRAMLDAKTLGLRYYDFWGIETSSGESPGFVRFKLGFAHSTSSGPAGGIKEYAGAYDIIFRPAGYRLYKILRKFNKAKQKISRR